MITIAAAVIERDGRLLICQRKKGAALGLKWEFPGGKLEAGETAEAALARELQEELGVGVAAADMDPFWFLSHTYHEFDFHLMMPVWVIRRWQGEPKALEHAAICWRHPNAMAE